MMDDLKNYKKKKRSFVNFLKRQGLDVKTNTKARGHQGIYFSNRIDISKNIDDKRAIEVMVHEFSHYIHSQIEPETFKTGGTLEKLFATNEISIIEAELKKVTNFIDKNSMFSGFIVKKDELNNDIKNQLSIIKEEYPDFTQTKKFKQFEKYIKKSKAKYLLKHDRIKIITPFLRREEYYNIDDIDKDFKDMPRSFKAYIRLNSLKRKRTRLTSIMNRLNKYYASPTELFARFVEALYKDKTSTEKIAPQAKERFFELLNQNYYGALKEIF